jgi:hypothetical protein
MAKKEKAKNSGVKRDKDLVRELTDLLPDIREEGLRFLINQARVLLHNQQVEKVNLEMEKLRNLERRKGSGAAPASSAQAAGGGVDIEESKDGGNFIMVLSPARKFLNREEMRRRGGGRPPALPLARPAPPRHPAGCGGERQKRSPPGRPGGAGAGPLYRGRGRLSRAAAENKEET